MLAESSEFNQMEGRCLGFRRAASVLKSLTWPVRCLEATLSLPCLGDHAKAVIDVRPCSGVCVCLCVCLGMEFGGLKPAVEHLPGIACSHQKKSLVWSAEPK